MVSDEAGMGQFAGPLADWGFADEGIASKYSKAPSGYPPDDPEYSNDEFEPVDGISSMYSANGNGIINNTNSSSSLLQCNL